MHNGKCNNSHTDTTKHCFTRKVHTWAIYTERQKKLITSSGWHSLKSTASKLVIFGHKQALILLNKNIWKTQDFPVSQRRERG